MRGWIWLCDNFVLKYNGKICLGFVLNIDLVLCKFWECLSKLNFIIIKYICFYYKFFVNNREEYI